MKKDAWFAGCAVLAIAPLSAAAAQTAPPLGAVDNAPASQTPTPTAKNANVDTGIGDIIVTAQRRSESLQKAALTIQVVDPKTLSNAGVTTPQQLTAVLPGIQVGTSGPAPSVYVRGVGSYSSTAGQSPAVPFYVDGVYLGRQQSVPSEFYDVDRLEALKGPQGTLYGRNASGGAINILTKKPSFKGFAASGTFELGNYGNQEGELAINVPLSQTLAVRASAQVVDRGGYTSQGFGDDKHQSARLKLLWEPSDGVSLLLNGSYGHIGGVGPAEVLLDPKKAPTNTPVAGWYPWLDISDPKSQALFAAFSPFPGGIAPPNAADGRQDLEFYNVSGELNWMLGNGITLTVVPAYRHSRIQHVSLLNFEYYNGYGIGNLPARPELSEQTSVEARLSGNSDRLKWVAGLYFYNEDQRQQYEIRGGLLQHNATAARYGTRSYAAFGQASLSLIDHVRAIAGLRYTSDKRSITDGVSYDVFPSIVFPGDLCAPVLSPATPICANDRYAGSKTFHNVSWKGGFEADVLDNGLAYATVSRGFKAGGFNTQSTLANPGSGTAVGKAELFKPETLTSYEIGLKNRFLNNRLQVNIEGFYWDYRDHQEPKIATTNANTFNLIYFNAGSSRIYGADIDIIARPWRGGTINLSGEYAHSKYPDFKYTIPSLTFNPALTGCAGTASANGTTTVDCSGFQVARTPTWSGSLGFTQEVALGVGELIGNATVNYASSRWLSIEFVDAERAKAYAVVNLSLTYQAPVSRWSLTGFVRNVNNGRDYSFATPNPLAPIFSSTIGTRRAYGARLSFNF